MRHLEHIHGRNVNLASRRYNIPVHELLDFSANISPLGPSPQSVSAVIDNLGGISSYPDPDCTELKSVLARPTWASGKSCYSWATGQWS